MSSTRKVVIASSASNQAKRLDTDAKTWGELKAKSEVAALIVGDVEAIVSPGKLTLRGDDSILPEGDFNIFLIPTKNKAGLKSYSDVGNRVAEAISKAAEIASEEDIKDLEDDLIEAVANHFDLDVSEIDDSVKEESVEDTELNDILAQAKSFS